MKMTGQRLLPVPRQQAWDALNDPEMLKACIPGCDSIVQTDPSPFEVLMAARIGPVAARFKGRLTQSDVVEPESYTLAFDGQGGVAGFGKGTAAVRLTPVEGGTMLDYEANAQVGGKIAQIGSRLVDAAAAKIADEFFKSFETKLTETAAADAASLRRRLRRTRQCQIELHSSQASAENPNEKISVPTSSGLPMLCMPLTRRCHQGPTGAEAGLDASVCRSASLLAAVPLTVAMTLPAKSRVCSSDAWSGRR